MIYWNYWYLDQHWRWIWGIYCKWSFWNCPWMVDEEKIDEEIMKPENFLQGKFEWGLTMTYHDLTYIFYIFVSNSGRVRPGDALDKGVRWRVLAQESSPLSDLCVKSHRSPATQQLKGVAHAQQLQQLKNPLLAMCWGLCRSWWLSARIVKTSFGQHVNDPPVALRMLKPWIRDEVNGKLAKTRRSNFPSLHESWAWKASQSCPKSWGPRRRFWKRGF